MKYFKDENESLKPFSGKLKVIDSNRRCRRLPAWDSRMRAFFSVPIATLVEGSEETWVLAASTPQEATIAVKEMNKVFDIAEDHRKAAIVTDRNFSRASTSSASRSFERGNLRTQETSQNHGPDVATSSPSQGPVTWSASRPPSRAGSSERAGGCGLSHEGSHHDLSLDTTHRSFARPASRDGSSHSRVSRESSQPRSVSRSPEWLDISRKPSSPSLASNPREIVLDENISLVVRNGSACSTPLGRRLSLSLLEVPGLQEGFNERRISLE